MMYSSGVSLQKFKLNTGAEIPAVGLGTWQLEGDKGYKAIMHALQNGYTLIDCAFSYFNQQLVGRCLKDSGLFRSEYYLIDKLANTWHSAANECLDKTLDSLGVDYLDLWLMHWPSPLNHSGNDPKTPRLPDGSIDFEKDWDYVKTWKAMIDIYLTQGDKVKSIGVANFGIEELEAIIQATGVVPSVNQVEIHPACNQQKLFNYCVSKGIQLMGYSPLGSIGSPLLQDQELEEIAKRNNASISQCLIGWGVALGWPVVPRSSTPERIDQNISLISLSEEDLTAITKIGTKYRQRFITAPWHEFADIE